MTDMGSSAGYTPVATETAPAAAGPAYPVGEVPEEIAQASGPARQDWIYHRLQDLHTGIHDQDGLDRYTQLKTAYCTEFTDPWCQGLTPEVGVELATIFFPWGRLLKGLRILGRSTTAAKGSPEVSQVLIRSPAQLQAKFKHALEFGVTGNYSRANAARFSEAIHQHINASGTRAIQGTYRGDRVTHYLDPSTGLNVIATRGGTFISGWRLNPAQLANVLQHGGL